MKPEEVELGLSGSREPVIIFEQGKKRTKVLTVLGRRVPSWRNAQWTGTGGGGRRWGVRACGPGAAFRV